MRYLYQRILLVIFCFLGVHYTLLGFFYQPEAQQGILDLRQQSLKDVGKVSLNGEWAFYWGCFLDETMKQELDACKQTYIGVPSSWTNQGYSSNGYATYRLKVLLDRDYSDLSLKVPEMATAYRLYINGELNASVGVVATNAAAAIPKTRSLLIDCSTEDRAIDLVMHISNYSNAKGGLWDNIKLGDSKVLLWEQERNRLVSVFLIGAILIIGLYHFVIYLLRTSDKQSLYFSVLCALALSRVLATGEMMIVELFPNIPWELRIKMEHLPYYSMAVVGLMFTKQLFPEEFNQKKYKAIIWIGGIISAISLLTPASIHTLMIDYNQFFLLYVLGYLFWGILVAVRKNRAGAIAYAIGIICIFISTVHDILYIQYIIYDEEYWTNYGIFIFFFSQAVVMAIKYSNAYKKAGSTARKLERLNIDLEEQVSERTRQLTQKTSQLELMNHGLKLSENEARVKAQELNLALKQLKDAQVQLVQSEKMASLGQLTAGIAHEINNPLNYIFVGLDNLKIMYQDMVKVVEIYDKIAITESEGERQELQQQLDTLKVEIDYESLAHDLWIMLGDMKSGAIRTAEIVKGLRTFSRLDEHAPKQTDIHVCIDSTLVILKNEYKNRIELIKDYGSDIPIISCLAGQINQVLMNLLNNAQQAVEGEGQVHITTRHLKQRNGVEILIQDSGVGISKEVQSKIFDPFFTTKDVGVGTGLGLSIAHGIVKKHKGYIGMESEVGVGTTFRLILPIDMDKGLVSE